MCLYVVKGGDISEIARSFIAIAFNDVNTELHIRCALGVWLLAAREDVDNLLLTMRRGMIQQTPRAADCEQGSVPMRVVDEAFGKVC